ncbi:MAG: HAMP domain-containing histidine kinase [Chrysiogenetes bacterium]|nr:HAMP domain-containing histidine kinase [Chrysiogenetes bacterium]
MNGLLPDFSQWPGPPGFYWGLFALGVLATIYPLVVTARRRVYYAFGILAFGSFYIMGPRMIWIMVPAGTLGVLIPWRLHYVMQVPAWFRFRRLSVREMKDRVQDLLIDGAVVLGTMLLLDFFYRRNGAGAYPIPIARGRDLLEFLAIAGALSGTWFAVRELTYRLLGVPGFASPPDEGVTPEGTEMLLFTNLAVYGLVFLIAAPVQLTIHYTYLATGPWPTLLVLLAAFYMNTLFTVWVERRERLRAALRDIHLSERMAAIGEVSSRIMHQMRHQLGLMAASTYILQRRLGTNRQGDQVTIEAELAKLDAVREQLRRLLVEELPGPDGEIVPDETGNEGAGPALRELVLVQAESLEPMAEQRGIRLHVGESNLGYVPRLPNVIGDAIFNVMENAVFAARGAVQVSFSGENGVACLHIIDDGPGIPEENLHKATQPFHTTKVDGTGMGLAIALSAARREGGEMELRNCSGGGLEVKFSFPGAGGEEEK